MNSTIEKVLKAVVVEFEQLPDSKELSEKVCKKLQNTYDNPPKRDFEILLQKVFSDDELRLFLFDPLDFQIEYFSRGIKNSLQFPAENPLRKAGSLLLTIIYLYHRYCVIIQMLYFKYYQITIRILFFISGNLSTLFKIIYWPMDLIL